LYSCVTDSCAVKRLPWGMTCSPCSCFIFGFFHVGFARSVPLGLLLPVSLPRFSLYKGGTYVTFSFFSWPIPVQFPVLLFFLNDHYRSPERSFSLEIFFLSQPFSGRWIEPGLCQPCSNPLIAPSSKKTYSRSLLPTWPALRAIFFRPEDWTLHLVLIAPVFSLPGFSSFRGFRKPREISTSFGEFPPFSFFQKQSHLPFFFFHSVCDFLFPFFTPDSNRPPPVILMSNFVFSPV